MKHGKDFMIISFVCSSSAEKWDSIYLNPSPLELRSDIVIIKNETLDLLKFQKRISSIKISNNISSRNNYSSLRVRHRTNESRPRSEHRKSLYELWEITPWAMFVLWRGTRPSFRWPEVSQDSKAKLSYSTRVGFIQFGEVHSRKKNFSVCL